MHVYNMCRLAGVLRWQIFDVQFGMGEKVDSMTVSEIKVLVIAATNAGDSPFKSKKKQTYRNNYIMSHATAESRKCQEI